MLRTWLAASDLLTWPLLPPLLDSAGESRHHAEPLLIFAGAQLQHVAGESRHHGALPLIFVGARLRPFHDSAGESRPLSLLLRTAGG